MIYLVFWWIGISRKSLIANTINEPAKPYWSKMRKYRNYSDAQFIQAVKDSLSLASVLRKLNLKEVGGNYKTIKNKINKMKLSISHFKGQAWNKENYKPMDGLVNHEAIKKFLIRKNGRFCWKCKHKEWMGQPIPLELEHKDGNNFNNSEDNLEILCPNCHAQTPTYRRSKNSLNQYKIDFNDGVPDRTPTCTHEAGIFKTPVSSNSTTGTQISFLNNVQ